MRLAPTLMAALCVVAGTAAAAKEQPMPAAAELKSMEARFAPVDVRVDVSNLPAEEREALVRFNEFMWSHMICRSASLVPTRKFRSRR